MAKRPAGSTCAGSAGANRLPVVARPRAPAGAVRRDGRTKRLPVAPPPPQRHAGEEVSQSAAGVSTAGHPCAAPRPAPAAVTAGGASITESAWQLSDDIVAQALADLLARRSRYVRSLMRRWEKRILKASIPGNGRKAPTKGMLGSAKRAVLQFYAYEESLGARSDVVKAFRLATGERRLLFDWPAAMARVRRAMLDKRQLINSWDECLAVASGASRNEAEIYVCGTKPLTLRALTSLVCHEGLHNLARRTRRGNPFLSEDLEHTAMALIGDPQLVAAEEYPGHQ